MFKKIEEAVAAYKKIYVPLKAELLFTETDPYKALKFTYSASHDIRTRDVNMISILETLAHTQRIATQILGLTEDEVAQIETDCEEEVDKKVVHMLIHFHERMYPKELMT